MKKIYIYGMGDYGIRLYNFLKDINVTISGFIKTKINGVESCEGVNAISINQLDEIGEDSIIIIAIADKVVCNYIRIKLLSKGIKDKRIIEAASFIKDNLPLESYRCIVCGSRFRSFIPGFVTESELFERHHIIGAGYREKMTCPICGAIDRTRWLYYVLITKTDIFDRDNVILHFAPEAFIRKRLQNGTNQYIPADICPYDGIIKMDIKDIPYKEDTFDYVIANHVLEHINDLDKAMLELKRVLKKDGKLIISFPICTDQNTIEEQKDIGPAERLRLFGQEDHVRLFGADYKEVIEHYGFRVVTYIPNELLDRDSIESGGFIEDDVIMICSDLGK